MWEGTLATEPEENLAKKPQIIYQFVTESAARFYYNSLPPEKAFSALTQGGGFECFVKFFWNKGTLPLDLNLADSFLIWFRMFVGKKSIVEKPISTISPGVQNVKGMLNPILVSQWAQASLSFLMNLHLAIDSRHVERKCHVN